MSLFDRISSAYYKFRVRRLLRTRGYDLPASFLVAALVVQVMQVGACAHRQAMRRIDAIETRCVAALDRAETPEQVRTILSLTPVIAQYFAEDWGEKQLKEGVALVLDWAAKHDIPTSRLFMGEFGVIAMSDDGRRGAPEPDRLRYLAAVRHLAEMNHIPWSVWEYSNPWGMSIIKPDGPAIPDAPMLQALGL